MAKKPDQPSPPDPFDTARAQSQQNRAAAIDNATLNRINTYTPWGSQEFDITGYQRGVPQYEQTINLSPEQQQLLDTQNQQDLALAGYGNEVIGQLRGGPMDTSGLPALGSDFASEYDVAGPQMSIDRSGLPGLPGADDLDAYRTEVSDALYGRNTRYLDDRYGRGEDQLRTRLANQGIDEGSEAYTNAMRDFSWDRDNAYTSAREGAIIGSGMEAERLNRIGLGNRSQLYGEELAGGSFANQAADQYTREQRGLASFGNAAVANSNAARSQGLSEQFALRNQPINEYSAYRSGTQVQTPNFGGPAQVGVAPADITGAVNNQYQGQVANYNANINSRNALMQGLFGLGGAYLLSDERAKEDIHEIGELRDGQPLYLYRYKGDDTPQVGVMAQEVEKTNPDAVMDGDDGYKRVDYTKVMAKALAA